MNAIGYMKIAVCLLLKTVTMLPGSGDAVSERGDASLEKTSREGEEATRTL